MTKGGRSKTDSEERRGRSGARAAEPATAVARRADDAARHVGAIYVAARTAAALGDAAAATRWLDRLAEVGLDDELDPDDFGAYAQSSEYRVRAARFAARAPPIGTPEKLSETQCGDLLPEGNAWDPKRGELLLSSARAERRVVTQSALHAA